MADDKQRLYEAVKTNDWEEFWNLLNANDQGENINSMRGLNGQTLLHLAVTSKVAPNMFRAILERMEHFTQRDENGNSVLELIYSTDYVEEAENAVKQKALAVMLDGDVEKMHAMVFSGWSYFPLTHEEMKEIFGMSEEALNFVEKLPELQVKINSIHKWIFEGEVQDVMRGLDKELIEAQDRTGLPPLIKAVILAKPDIVTEIAKEYPDNLNIKDNLERTALHYAGGFRDGGHMYQILKEAGADETIVDKQGHSPAEYLENPDLLDEHTVRQRIMDILQSPLLTERPKPDESQDGPKETGDPDKEDNKKTMENPPTSSIRTPISMYVGRDIYEQRNVPPPNTIDGKYLAQNLGTALTQALSEIAERRPWDPIEYLAMYLYKFRENFLNQQHQKDLLQQIIKEQEEQENELVEKQKRKEEQKLIREEEKKQQKLQREEEERAQKELEEQQKKAKEAALAQPPDLPTVKEEIGEAEVNAITKGKDEHGQTELHKLAGQEGADLVALFNMGYSLADRDEEYRTPRDIAEDKGVDDNVETIDNHITNLIEGEKIDTLQQLLLDGYDKMSSILDKISTDGLPEDVTSFISAIPDFQARIKNLIKAVRSGVLREVQQGLERKVLALAKDNRGRTPLHNAVLYGHSEVTEYIVKTFPVSLKGIDNLNRTPLHYAAGLSDELFDLLVENGADMTLKDVKGKTPGDYKDDKEEIIKLKEEAPGIEVTTPEEEEGEKTEEAVAEQPDDQEDNEEPEED